LNSLSLSLSLHADTANLAAFLTINQLNAGISSIYDLRGKAVTTVPAYVSRLRSRYGLVAATADIVTFADIEGQGADVAAGEISAFLYDEPMLAYLASRYPKCAVRVLPSTYEPFDFGLAWRKGTTTTLVEGFSGGLGSITHPFISETVTRL
jgi:ABC-type amino acid transport substrate-binding protein